VRDVHAGRCPRGGAPNEHVPATPAGARHTLLAADSALARAAASTDLVSAIVRALAPDVVLKRVGAAGEWRFIIE
jgi:hypothetical protein